MRRRRAFSTYSGRLTFGEAKRVRGYSAARAEQVFDALREHLAGKPFISGPLFRGSLILSETLHDRIADEIVAQLVPGGLAGLLFWSAAKFFIRWLVRRLLAEWEASPWEFGLVMEDLDDGNQGNETSALPPGQAG